MENEWAVAEITIDEDEPELRLIEFLELLETLNAIYVGVYQNQRKIERLNIDPLQFDEDDFYDQEELHRFIGQLQEEGVLEDIRSNTRKWSAPSVEEDLRIQKIIKQSPALIQIAGAGVPLLILLWFANSFEGEYTVEDEYGPDGELESKSVKKRIAFNTSSLSGLIDILERRYK
jgi:hypothetical protein